MSVNSKLEILQELINQKRDDAAEKSEDFSIVEIDNLISSKLFSAIQSIGSISIPENKQISSIDYMNKIITETFKLDFDKFNNLLIECNSYVAGSSSTSGFTKSNFQKMDLDIWITSLPWDSVNFTLNPDFSEEKHGQIAYDKELNKWIESGKTLKYPKKVNKFISENENKTVKILKKKFDSFFSEYNVLPDRLIFNKNSVNGYLENDRFKEIVHKMYYYKINDQVIQLIFTPLTSEELIKTFDLSFCATVWDGTKFNCLEPELTSKKIGYVMNGPSNDREIQRRQKYLDRGFKIFETKEEANEYSKTLGKNIY